MIDSLLDQLPVWLEKVGPYSDMVLFSKVSLYRNIGGYKFNKKTSDKEKEEMLDLLVEGIPTLSSFKDIISLEELEDNEKRFFVERNFISREQAGNCRFLGLALNDLQNNILVLNSDEHLEISSISPELAVKEAFIQCDNLDDELNGEFNFAYNNELGFLTSSVDKVGTGMVVSAMVHLPALVITSKFVEVIDDLEDSLFTIDGVFNIGESVEGSYFKISNRFTLGVSEEEILELFENKIKGIMKNEVNSREYLTQKVGYETEDKIWRSYGILRNARILSVTDFLNLISAVRLGLSLGIIRDINIIDLNKWLFQALPGHLSVLNKDIKNEKEENVLRARIVRSNLGG
jgi:protein arginine kinase